MNHNAVCKTSPATPGLSINVEYSNQQYDPGWFSIKHFFEIYTLQTFFLALVKCLPIF